MLAGRSFKKAKREDKGDTTVETKRYRQKDGHSFKKRLSTLNVFSGHSRNVRSPERNLLLEDKKRGLQRKESKTVKTPKEEICSSRRDHSGKMCPKCELIICRVCNVLHTESSFIAHSLLDHYDQGRHSSCCSEPEFFQDHHKCKQSQRISLKSNIKSCNLARLENKLVLKLSQP